MQKTIEDKSKHVDAENVAAYCGELIACFLLAEDRSVTRKRCEKRYKRGARQMAANDLEMSLATWKYFLSVDKPALYVLYNAGWRVGYTVNQIPAANRELPRRVDNAVSY